MKEQSKVEVLNDINLDLICLYRVIQHHLEEFLRQFKWALTSRKMFEWLNETPPETLTDIQRAARFFYLQKLSFGGKVDGRTFGTAASSPPRLNLMRIEEELSQAHLRLVRVCIEHLSWQRCIEKYDREYTLFYLDPPYWQTEGYGVPFGIEQYQVMAQIMRSMKGKAILSINDHPDIQKTFSGLPNKNVTINYTVGGGANPATRKELIIWNW
jgi:DNA adenine methylase